MFSAYNNLENYVYLTLASRCLLVDSYHHESMIPACALRYVVYPIKILAVVLCKVGGLRWLELIGCWNLLREVFAVGCPTH